MKVIFPSAENFCRPKAVKPLGWIVRVLMIGAPPVPFAELAFKSTLGISKNCNVGIGLPSIEPLIVLVFAPVTKTDCVSGRVLVDGGLT